ncbi:MAG: putative transposase DNA-binding domain [Candidatus Diapherotrites archaeon]|nr:putative transposase DNA-binding domain [Candidatus Diapherotrites archaeon]MDN5366823.1 putative transposase DNA-binding domain [Candidatus Diapherotrites archaeon]
MAVDTGSSEREDETKICPNCGHEMVKIGDIWVCPECEYHSDADPEHGTFR